jgi:hypothetical protein
MQLTLQSISNKDGRMKASKEMTAMAIKHHTKRHTRCCTVLVNRLTMLTATTDHIQSLSTIYINSDATPVDSFPKFSATRASSAQGPSPAGW